MSLMYTPKYAVVRARDLYTLKIDVDDKLYQGWALQGGVSAVSSPLYDPVTGATEPGILYMQAMTK